MLPLFLPIAVAVVAGDSIAGEAQAGTLRYLLARPAGRTRLLVAKLVAVLASSLLAVVVVTVTGVLRRHQRCSAPSRSAARSLVSGTPLTAQQCRPDAAGDRLCGLVDARRRRVRAVPLDGHRLAARRRLGALAFLVASSLLLTLDAAARSRRTCRPGTGWRSSTSSGDPILWRDILRGIGLQAVYVVVLLGAAWANFTTKDIKS